MLVLTTISSTAQEYQRVVDREQWSMGRNVTGILRDSLTISYAELYLDGERGDFRNFSDASSMWSAGVEAQTLTHHNNISMIGAFGYDHTSGSDMSGSMFISPNAYPFDLLEFTPGDKTLQSYYLMGGISMNLSSGWSIGLKGDFTAQNYAKFKDLRHYNYRMDLSLVPSIAYTFGESTLGLSYIYSRNSEIVRAQEIGSSSSSYYAFLDKGLMTGAYETWQGTGVHLDESGVDGFPVRENLNGVAVQAEWRDLYLEMEYLQGRGEVGEKLTYWFDFPSHTYSLRIGYNILRSEMLHLIRVESSYGSLTNYESVLGSNTSGGVTTTTTYGSNLIFAKKEVELKPKYELRKLDGSGAFIGLNYLRTMNRSTLMYPYVDELATSVYQGYVGGYHPFGSFELRGQLLYSVGELDQASYSVESSVEAGDRPIHLEEYYNVNNEFLTANYLKGSLSLRYSHSLGLYCELGARYTQAFDLNYITGCSRFGYTLKVGYNF